MCFSLAYKTYCSCYKKPKSSNWIKNKWVEIFWVMFLIPTYVVIRKLKKSALTYSVKRLFFRFYFILKTQCIYIIWALFSMLNNIIKKKLVIWTFKQRNLIRPRAFVIWTLELHYYFCSPLICFISATTITAGETDYK